MTKYDKINRRPVNWHRVFAIGYAVFAVAVIAFIAWQFTRTETLVEWRDPDTGMLLERSVTI